MTTTTAGVIEHAIGATGAFALDVHSTDVRIEAVDGDTVRLRTRDDEDLDHLSVEAGAGLLAVRIDGGLDDLDVQVPHGATVVVEGSSGDLHIRGLRAEQRYRTSSGDIQLDGVGGDLTAEAVSGDVRIVAVDAVTVSARTVSGDLAVQAGDIRSLRATTTSGDLRVAGRFAPDGTFTLETVSGDATLAPAGDLGVTVTTITGDVRSDIEARQEGPRGERRVIVGSGHPALTFRSTSGDLRVTRAVPHPTAAPQPPMPPTPPRPPLAPPPPTLEEAAPMTDHDAVAAETEQLDVLRALERGEIDVAEATRRLTAMTDAPADPEPADDATTEETDDGR